MLKDFINWESLMTQPRTAGGHFSIMDNLFKDSKVLGYYIEQDYQGQEAFVYKLKKRYQKDSGSFILVTDYFGSCGGCDSYEDCSDEQLRNLCIQLANNAHSFKSLGALIDFVKSSHNDASYYDVTSVASGVISALETQIERHVMIEKY